MNQIMLIDLHDFLIMISKYKNIKILKNSILIIVC